MSDQERPDDKEKRDEQKTTITIAERPSGEEPDEKDTITVAEKGGE